jgi:hypothetical protein
MNPNRDLLIKVLLSVITALVVGGLYCLTQAPEGSEETYKLIGLFLLGDSCVMSGFTYFLYKRRSNA